MKGATTTLEQKESTNVLETLKGVSRSNVADGLCHQISELILEGKIQPGYTFPNELSLCEYMGVGRSTLREAFRTLEAMGLIVKTKRGTFVSDKVNRHEALPFPQILKYFRIRDIMEFRNTLEVEIAAFAAERANEDDINALECLLGKMKIYVKDSAASIHWDTQFHCQLAIASQNELLMTTLGMVRESIETVMLEAIKNDNTIPFRALDWHEQLLTAVRLGQPEEAREIMRKHMNDVASTLKKGVQPQAGSNK
jgi:GntR family transcriptional regulator, transcriptional repressor for pyruvate dehydrogenase complex